MTTLVRTKLKDETSWMWYILMGLYFFYYTYTSLFPSLAFVGQLLIFLILFICLINLWRALMFPYALPNCMRLIIVMLVILTLSYFISPKFVYTRFLPSISTLNQFKDMVAFFIPIFTGFCIGIHKRLLPKQWAIISLIIFVLAVNSYFETKVMFLREFNREEATNNAGYIFLYILPFLPLVLNKYKLLVLALLGAIFVFIMLCAKRGAIICMACMILYLLWWYLTRRRISFGTIVSILVLVTALVIGLNYFFSESDYLQRRLEQTLEGNSSHRDVLYSVLWDAWLKADFLKQLFGRGIAQTVNVAGNYAHNDWLELLTDVGFLGAFVYLMIIVSLFMFRKKLPKSSPEQAAFTVVIIFWFLKTIFSMGMGIMGGISMMLLGTLMGNAMGANLFALGVYPRCTDKTFVEKLNYDDSKYPL